MGVDSKKISKIDRNLHHNSRSNFLDSFCTLWPIVYSHTITQTLGRITFYNSHLLILNQSEVFNFGRDSDWLLQYYAYAAGCFWLSFYRLYLLMPLKTNGFCLFLGSHSCGKINFSSSWVCSVHLRVGWISGALYVFLPSQKVSISFRFVSNP